MSVVCCVDLINKKLSDFLILDDNGNPLTIEYWEEYYLSHPELVNEYYRWITESDA